MLAHPTLDLLHTLGLHGMAKGFSDLAAQPSWSNGKPPCDDRSALKAAPGRQSCGSPLVSKMSTIELSVASTAACF
jgi:hypothetical protein